jgi:hypothetical protein
MLMAYAIDGQARLIGVKEGGGYGGGVKTWTQHLEAQSRVAEMARSGGDLRRHSRTRWCGRGKRGPIGGAHMAAS